MDQGNQYDLDNPNPIDPANPDTIRRTAPDGQVWETQGGQTQDPNNDVVDLPDGRQMETPPANLAAAKDTLAAENSARRDDADYSVDPSADIDKTGLAGRPSYAPSGQSGVAGGSTFDPAYSPAHQGVVGSPSYSTGDAGMSNDRPYDEPDQGIDTQGYDTSNQGLGSPNEDPSQRMRQGQGQGSYDPNQGMGGQEQGGSYDPDQGMRQGQGQGGSYDPNQGMGGQGNYDPNQGMGGDQSGYNPDR
ncbi:MAG TPA: hypothetical protein VF812_03530 [Ktedonobacterales bacterium]